MSRKIKKLIAALLSAVMVVSLMTATKTVTAYADQTITFHFQNIKEWETVGAWIYEGLGWDTCVTDSYVKSIKSDGTVKNLWPGAKCEDEGNGWVKVSATFSDALSGAVMIFNNFVGDATPNATEDEEDIEAIRASGIPTTDTATKDQTSNIVLTKRNVFKNGIPSDVWINYDGSSIIVSTEAPKDYVDADQLVILKVPEGFEWNADPELDNTEYIKTYIEGSDSNKIVDANKSLWEITVKNSEDAETERFFSIEKKASNAQEYVSNRIYGDNKDDLLLKKGKLYCGDNKVAENVVKFDDFYALTEAGELIVMSSGDVAAENVIDYAADGYGYCVFLDNNKNLTVYDITNAKTELIDTEVKEITQSKRSGVFVQYLKENGEVYSMSADKYSGEWNSKTSKIAEDVEDILLYTIYRKNDGSILCIDNTRWDNVEELLFDADENIVSAHVISSRYEKYVPLSRAADLKGITFVKDNGEEIYLINGEKTSEKEAVNQYTKQYQGYTSLSKSNYVMDYVKDGNLYKKNNMGEDILVMTNVVDAGYFTMAMPGRGIVCTRMDGSVWLLNYNKNIEIKLGNILSIEDIQEEVVKGDFTGDGDITVKDSAVLKRFLAGWEEVEINKTAADLNGDGDVNVKDSALLKRYLAGWDVTFAN